MTKTGFLVAVLSVLLVHHGTTAFSPTCFVPRHVVVLEMGKGLNRARNKQADLLKKMELARQQKEGDSATTAADHDAPMSLSSLSNAEIKKQNDQKRFEQLLREESSNVLSAYSKDGYLNKEQEEEEITAARAGIERLFEGDPAPVQPFEELVSIKSENAIGKGGASRLVPWLRKNEARRGEYLIVLTDPRMKSPELRETVKNASANLPDNIKKRLIVINADSPAENRRYVCSKKNKTEASGLFFPFWFNAHLNCFIHLYIKRWLKKNASVDLDIYSDEKMEWMQAYTALGQKRFSICMFILADERIQKLARDVDGVFANRVIQNAVKSLDTGKDLL